VTAPPPTPVPSTPERPARGWRKATCAFRSAPGYPVLLLGETVPSNLALVLVLVMPGVAALTVPSERPKGQLTKH